MAQRGTAGIHSPLFFLVILRFMMLPLICHIGGVTAERRGQVPVCASVKPPRRGRAGFCGLQSVVVFI